jgi:hypothetical protein
MCATVVRVVGEDYGDGDHDYNDAAEIDDDRELDNDDEERTNDEERSGAAG